MSSSDISMPITKAATAITAATAANTDVAAHVAHAAVANASYATWIWVNSVPWGLLASMLAAFYTLLLISEWWWKKFWRPLFESRGWIKPLRRRIISVEEYDRVGDDA